MLTLTQPHLISDASDSKPRFMDILSHGLQFHYQQRFKHHVTCVYFYFFLLEIPLTLPATLGV
jgi:hypothetical protein